MNKLFIAAAFLFLFNSCNDHAGQHTGHSASDSSGHEAHSSTTEISEMKQVMDGMMTKMHGQKPTGNNDIDYANMMLQHHQGAVDMAKLQISKGSDTSLKSFSAKVIEDQQKEIALMAEFISRSKAIASPNSSAFIKALEASMDAMMSTAVEIYNDIDKDFVAQMIPHHQSAVDMANAYLKYGKDPGLIKMSTGIVTSQTREIDWLKNRGRK